MRSPSRRLTALTLLLLLAVPARADDTPAPATRGDLGRSLRRFEAAWEASREALTPEQRAAVCRHVTAATFGFFTGKFDGAIEGLARAGAVARGTDPAREAVHLRGVLPLVSTGDVTVEALVFRPLGVAAKAEQQVAISIAGARLETTLPAAAGARVKLRLRTALAPGVHELVLEVDGARLEARPVSAVDDLERRLAAITSAVASLPEGARRASTLAVRAARLERLRAGQDDGVDRDLGVELALLERDLAAVVAGKDPFAGRAGDELRAVGGVVYRQVVPAGAHDGPRPLVVLLHGAGGDEDMFCESYGAGIVPRLAAAAGAIVVAPRAPSTFAPTGGADVVRAVVDAVASEHAVDPTRVYLVGHSMGAAMALDAARAAPGRYRAVAVFAGASRGAPADLPPTYLAVGSGDVALLQVRGFVAAARRSGAPVTVDEREGLEHLLIVREAAPAAFAFLAEHGLATSPGPAPAAPPRRYY